MIEVGQEVRLMTYGSSGMGKTHFLGTANDDKRVTPNLLLDLEGGVSTIKSKCRLISSINDLGSPEEGLIDVLRIKNFDDLQRAYDFIMEKKSRDKRAAYNSVSLDSLTEINYLGLKHAMGTSPVPKLEPDVPEQRDYLKCNTMMKAMLRAFRDVEGLHVFYSCLPQTKMSEGDSIGQIMPALIGKLAEEAVAILDYVGYLKMNVQKKRVMVFQPEGRVLAKERTEVGSQIKLIEEPTIAKVLDALGVVNAN